MSEPSRFDSLLDRALVTGEVPPEATPEERRELEELLVAAGVIRATSAAIDAEAAKSKPVTRARFERFVQQAGRPATAAPWGRRPFRRMFGLPRGLALAGSAVAAGLLAVVLLVVSQGALDSTDTAVAEVLQPGDYVQLDGIVSDDSGEGEGRVLTLLTEFGSVRVSLSPGASVTAGDSGEPPARFRPGDNLTLSGNVSGDRSVLAHAVALLDHDGQPPTMMRPRHLGRQSPGVTGRVVVLAVTSDGNQGRVLLDAGEGRHYLVTVDSESISKLITASTHAPGARVTLSPHEGDRPGVFTVAVDSEPMPGHRMHGLRGVILEHNGDSLEVETARGRFTVTLTDDTRIILAQSGLDRAEFMADGGGVGHHVVVVGPIHDDTAAADVLAVGPRATGR